MSHDANEGDPNVLKDLEPEWLRTAVDQVRRKPVPAEALQRALNRAQALNSVRLAVRRQPSVARRTRHGIQLFAACACLLLGVALVWGIGKSIQNTRESARRSTTSNNLKQLGLALHNYHETFRVLPPSSLTPPSSKVIHAADLMLVVAEIKSADSQLNELVLRFKGYVSNSQLAEPKGQQRSARWVIRVPVDQLDAFVKDVVKLGVPENRSTDARDVTEEYVDLKTRIENKLRLEKRILALLETNTGHIKDVLSVEEQLARVREEIEIMEGRVKQMDLVTSMATVAISAREERDYVPPQAPSFSIEIERTWARSLELMQNCAKALVLTIVAVGPWLPLIVVIGLIGLGLLRRRLARLESSR